MPVTHMLQKSKKTIKEDLTAQVGSGNTTFTTTSKFATGKISVYVRGFHQRPVVEYTEAADGTSIEMITAPEDSGWLTTEYEKRF